MVAAVVMVRPWRFGRRASLTFEKHIGVQATFASW
jgi:hypothetical protein